MKEKIYSQDAFEKLLVDVRDASKDEDGIAVVMCECAFGDTTEELQLMGKRIKEIVRAGGTVHVIK